MKKCKITQRDGEVGSDFSLSTSLFIKRKKIGYTEINQYTLYIFNLSVLYKKQNTYKKEILYDIINRKSSFSFGYYLNNMNKYSLIRIRRLYD